MESGSSKAPKSNLRVFANELPVAQVEPVST